jgi:hypothetical protein
LRPVRMGGIISHSTRGAAAPRSLQDQDPMSTETLSR